MTAGLPRPDLGTGCPSLLSRPAGGWHSGPGWTAPGSQALSSRADLLVLTKLN